MAIVAEDLEPTSLEWFVALCQVDPVEACRAYGEEPWPIQQEIMRSVWANRETWVRSSHLVGKTWSAARVVACWVRAWAPDVLVVVIAPTDRQLMGGLWRELITLSLKWPLPGEVLSRIWKGPEGVMAIGAAPRADKGGGTLQGLHHHRALVVVDEAAVIEGQLWEEIPSLLGGANTRFLAAGNPTEIGGPFFRAFQETPLPETKRIAVSAFDTPNLAGIDPNDPNLRERLMERLQEPSKHPGLIDARLVLNYLDRRDHGEEWVWSSRILGEFPDVSEDSLIKRVWVRAARARKIDNESEPLQAGLDIAGRGKDRTVLMPRRGPIVYEPFVWQGLEGAEIVGRVMEWAKGKNVRGLYVDTGFNPMVYEQLRDRVDFPVLDVISGEKPRDPENFVNRRDEMWWGLRERLEQGTVDLSRLPVAVYEELENELCSVQFKYQPTGRRKVEPKEDTKKRLGRSPDIADALVYAMSGTGAGESWRWAM